MPANEMRRIADAALARIGKTMHGVVSAVDPVNHAVKVIVQPDGVESGWIPDVCAIQVGDLRISCPSAPGTHVLLQPVEGDAEHLTVIGRLYDTVMRPPLSPVTGKAAQPGEMLIRLGCGAPPPAESAAPGAVREKAPWLHLTPEGIYSGVGEVTHEMTGAEQRWTVGETVMTLDRDGLKVSGGVIASDREVLASGIALKRHRHPHGHDDAPTGEPQ